jgi:CubicO group peptidase (beta-lactamase class C family)
LSFSSCYFTKALKYKKYKLEDLPDFEAEHFEKSERPFQFKRGSLDFKTKIELDSMLNGSNRYAFAVIRNDSILYEFYNKNIADSSLLPSFSVAKSFVSTMVGIALEEGKIKSLKEPITNYLPELKKRDDRFSNITIQHVLDMRSGIKSSENYYNPLSDVLRLGFGRNIFKKALKLKIESEPNQTFEYKSVNTQLLGFIVERSTGQKLQTYFNDKIYRPLAMQYAGSWIVDDKKHRELRAFCCMNLALLDYAKFGKLFLDRGQFNGQRIVSENWVSASTNADTLQAYDGYKNQWWRWGKSKFFTDTNQMNQFIHKNPTKIISKKVYRIKDDKAMYIVGIKNASYSAMGLLNQYIHVIPEKNMIIVHFGNSQNPNNPQKSGFEQKIEELF